MRGIPTRYIIGLEGDERDSKTNWIVGKYGRLSLNGQ
jgi:hypothetical protein